MTTIGIPHDHRRALVQPAWGARVLRSMLLGCGIVAPIVYALTDLFGGLRYPGYSFSSQAISELMAVGAPSEGFVDPLFGVFGVLVLAFGVAVFREAAGGNRALRITGALLIVYAIAGAPGPVLLEMSQRGGTGGNDLGHIILTSVLVLLTLVAMGFGAFALGRRFRIYSLATLGMVILFGVLTAPSGARLAAGQPTPGLGILERINVYTSMLWFAVLAMALLQTRGRVRRAT